MVDAASRYRMLVRTGLGFYAIVCLALFVWLRFSFDSVKYKFEDSLTRILGSQVILGHISPTILGGLSIDGMEISGEKVVKKLSVSPKPWNVFRGSMGIGFHAELAGGNTDGRIIFPFRKSKTPMNITINMSNVDLAGFSKVFPPALSPKGVITGELNLTTMRNSLDKATGNLSLSWKKGTLPLGMVTLPFDALVFDNLDFDGKIDKGLLNIEKADFTGEFSGSMNGNIRFSKEIKRSRLAVMGELNLPEPMKKALGPEYGSPGQGNRFSLRGSIERPRFRMLGANMRSFSSVPAASPGTAPAPETTPAGQPQVLPPPIARQGTDRVRQDSAAPAQPTSAMDRHQQDKSAADDMQDMKDPDQEVQ